MFEFYLRFVVVKVLVSMLSCSAVKVFLILVGSLAMTSAQATPGKMIIVTTLPFLSEIVREVSCGSQEISVSSLVPPGVDPHTFQLRPADRAKIVSAQGVIAVGQGMDPWLDKVPAGSAGKKMDVTQGMALSKRDGFVDLHIWHSPELVAQASRAVAKFLSTLKPAIHGTTEKCAAQFESKITAVAAALKSRASAVPESNRTIATTHDAFGYFADAFGFKVVGLLGGSTDAAVTPQQLRRVVDRVKKNEVRAIFVENGASNKAIETLARESKARIGGELFADGPGAAEVPTLIAMWQKNMDTVVAALK